VLPIAFRKEVAAILSRGVAAAPEPQSGFELYVDKQFRKATQPYKDEIFECYNVEVFDAGTRVRLHFKMITENAGNPVLYACSLASFQEDFRAACV